MSKKTSSLSVIGRELKRSRQLFGLIRNTVPFHTASFVADVLLDDDGGTISHRCAQLYGRAELDYVGMNVTVRGAENLEGLDRYCVVSNHASYLDFAMALGHFPTSFRFIAKRELIYMPFIGRWLRHHGVLIDRKRGDGAKEAIRRAVESDSRVPILIFAEGTRTPDGILQPFKRGGLTVLAEGGLDMLPVAMLGTYEAFSRHDRTIVEGSNLELVIGEPVRASDFGPHARITEVERRVKLIVADYYGPERANLDPADYERARREPTPAQRQRRPAARATQRA
ncbi:MAG: 1-acyl-sn-glycerol-3-phosphate acyltransferase [Myxococcales bacterium]|nr:1-acyl-sn-glycerol-3-phosphate acyltransferase [Myxococcales bacterium]